MPVIKIKGTDIRLNCEQAENLLTVLLREHILWKIRAAEKEPAENAECVFLGNGKIRFLRQRKNF